MGFFILVEYLMVLGAAKILAIFRTIIPKFNSLQEKIYTPHFDLFRQRRCNFYEGLDSTRVLANAEPVGGESTQTMRENCSASLGFNFPIRAFFYCSKGEAHTA